MSSNPDPAFADTQPDGWLATGRSPASAADPWPGATERSLWLDGPPSHPSETRLVFTGTGGEYFRMWIVHLLLTLLSLGVYSAWAKARKARWFARHTQLLGDSFDYHGSPARILIGRILSLFLLGLYLFAFDLSASAALLTVGLLCALGPMLFASAQRFRLANTSWRGLAFDYRAEAPVLYLACVPLILLWTGDSLMTALGWNPWWGALTGGLVVLALPWAHARLKSLQHSHTHFGGRRFNFTAVTGDFYRIHFKAWMLALLAMLMAMAAFWLANRVWPDLNETVAGLLLIAALLSFWTMFAWPFYAARMQQVVWANTRLGPLRFRGDMVGRELCLQVTVHTLLTLLTAGLYWPFAAVALARYRVQAMVVLCDGALEPEAQRLAVSRRRTGQGGAVGEGASDHFGIDLGW
jgi:uncharacterized membrane protein YjgN (DUF898 family)